MTIQASGVLMYNGKEYLFRSYPLEVYFKLGGRRVPFMADTTACRRGYVGTWAIDNGELRLIDIYGHIAEEPTKDIASRAFKYHIDYDDPKLCRRATVDAIFPDHDGPIFAHWYSAPIEAIDSASRSVKLLAEVKRGRVVSLKTEPVGDQA